MILHFDLGSTIWVARSGSHDREDVHLRSGRRIGDVSGVHVSKRISLLHKVVHLHTTRQRFQSAA